MTTPTKESLAAALAKSIYEQIASPLERAKEKALAPFRGLQMQPTISVNPDDGSLLASASESAQRSAEIDATLERLLRAAGRARRARGAGGTALVIDEFQEIVEIDREPAEALALGLPARNLRSPTSTWAASTTSWSGSSTTPTSRSGAAPSRSSSGTIPVEPFAAFIVERFRATGKRSGRTSSTELLAPHRRPSLRDPGALLLPLGADRHGGGGFRERSSERRWTAVLRSEHAHFSLLWEDASAVQKRILLGALARETGPTLHKRLPGAATSCPRQPTCRRPCGP